MGARGQRLRAAQGSPVSDVTLLDELHQLLDDTPLHFLDIGLLDAHQADFRLDERPHPL